MACDAEHKEVAPVKIFLLWTNISGYMCENWRELAARPDIELKGIASRTDLARDNAAFGLEVLDSLDIQLADSGDRDLLGIATRQILDQQPDVIFVAGWSVPTYRRAIQSMGARHALGQRSPKIVMAMDTPWLGRPKQYLTRYALAGYLKYVDAVLTAGDRSVRYAQRLGFRTEQIFKGLYSWDPHLRIKCQEIKPPSRSGFLFVGRYIPEKGLSTLISAYSKYRSMVAKPWDLTCCGAGPLHSLLNGQPGVRNAGFVAPSDLPVHFAQARVFVLPSLFEPWGVAIAEAMGCGLPAIVSAACGAGDDLIEPGVSGFVVPTGSVEALAAQMAECHRNEDRLNDVGILAARSASRFTSTEWAIRFRRILKELLPDSCL